MDQSCGLISKIILNKFQGRVPRISNSSAFRAHVHSKQGFGCHHISDRMRLGWFEAIISWVLTYCRSVLWPRDQLKLTCSTWSSMSCCVQLSTLMSTFFNTPATSMMLSFVMLKKNKVLLENRVQTREASEETRRICEFFSPGLCTTNIWQNLVISLSTKHTPKQCWHLVI